MKNKNQHIDHQEPQMAQKTHGPFPTSKSLLLSLNMYLPDWPYYLMQLIIPKEQGFLRILIFQWLGLLPPFWEKTNVSNSPNVIISVDYDHNFYVKNKSKSSLKFL